MHTHKKTSTKSQQKVNKKSQQKTPTKNAKSQKKVNIKKTITTHRTRKCKCTREKGGGKLSKYRTHTHTHTRSHPYAQVQLRITREEDYSGRQEYYRYRWLYNVWKRVQASSTAYIQQAPFPIVRWNNSDTFEVKRIQFQDANRLDRIKNTHSQTISLPPQILKKTFDWMATNFWAFGNYHGDLSVSNFIWESNALWIIDYEHGGYENDPEEFINKLKKDFQGFIQSTYAHFKQQIAHMFCDTDKEQKSFITEMETNNTDGYGYYLEYEESPSRNILDEIKILDENKEPITLVDYIQKKKDFMSSYKLFNKCESI